MQTKPTETSKPGPLAGLKVIDCATLFAGPLCASMMGDFGADVIKIEHPTGDPLRRMGYEKNGHGLWWKVVSRNKRTISLNLKEPRGKAVFEALIADADVLVENFRTGTLESWGLGWEDLKKINPRLVMLRVTGFGQTGPYARRAGFGTLAEAMSGFAHITGEPDGPPTLPPFGLADGVAAYWGVFSTMFALYDRDAKGSGLGQYIDLAIYEPLFSLLGAQSTVFDQLGIIQNRTGNRSVNNAPRNAYRTREGRWVALSAAAPSIVRRVLTLTGGAEWAADPRFTTTEGRLAAVDEIDRVIGGWIGERGLAEVVAAFEEAEAAIAPIYDVEQAMSDPQFVARETVTEIEDADLGPLRMQNVFPRMSRTPGSIRWGGPRHDEHGAEIVADLVARGRLPGDGAEAPSAPTLRRKPWDRYLSDADRAVLEKGRFGRRMGFGSRPAIVAIDCQKYMVGEEGDDESWPSSCGAAGRAGLARAAHLVGAAQKLGIPVFFTRYEIDPSGRDIGVYGRKRDLMDTPHWCLAGSKGAELADSLVPSERDIVFVKKKPSGFHGTPLLGYLNDRHIDTVIVVGGATSNCIRATVFDSASYNFRTIVAEDAVFDRLQISHAISLFDMDRQFADVMPVDDVVAALTRIQAGPERA